MKRYTVTLSLLFIIGIVYWSFYDIMPHTYTKENAPENTFSAERALILVRAMSRQPHYVGSPAHKEVREYLLSELKKLGLEPEVQEGYTAGNWGNLSKARNILARIKGSGDGNALMLLSHYDSSPHSSFGASDAASGVATILEGIRAFLPENKTPENDIIILFSDAEELGLNGARLFVNQHPWAKDVKLVLNFEARGSGGPGFMLVETNGGNSGLIREFTRAQPRYPVSNSFMYSVYKMLPNDTDLTVFREDGNIDGFNFAFIDDHYDYHTALDTEQRLDRNTLEHQGSYLMPLLHYFSNADITNLKSDEDYVFFDGPFTSFISYPFSWIWPMMGIAAALFILLIFYGIRKKSIVPKEVFIGIIPFVVSLLLCGLIGYYSWPVLKKAYPDYADILHGFTYNGYYYIAAFTALSIAICFFLYHKFHHIRPVNLLIFPVFLWIVICGLLGVYLKGASFFIIPVYAALLSLLILIRQERPNLLLQAILTVPAIWIFAPFIQMFPIGLGLKMMIASTLFTVLLFGLLLPVFGFYRQQHKLALFAGVLTVALLIAAHIQSGFTENSPKPDSLLYVLNTDTGKASWATYDQVPDEWTSAYIGQDPQKPEDLSATTIASKYNTGFSYTAGATVKHIPPPRVDIVHDTLRGTERELEVCITPQRNVTRLEVFSDTENIISCKVNGVALSQEYLRNPKRKDRLFSHYITDNAYTEILLRIPADENPELTLFEASNDLLENPLFTVPPRPKDRIPMPFVLNDAIVVKKTVTFGEGENVRR
ncbi:M28 family peptidase [Sinomicrobium weinanense]|uniref:Vacuolar membrane protease n=1 Tax=Sinomicrobium weinanense TaxID=2842200 RepID=A0A926Q3V4_9FLAO|nr:M28 family peptidase [Sinomicrobium weinanense]MBC9797963.1 M28 family peptidase [Sinomicrobium weinanense]MBU3123101.1 M28 family peptidase [Sinomicrobium weinanense]